jgi:predicted deacetylase
VPEPRAHLLVSLHDVSPLTLDLCRDAIDLLGDAGIAPPVLTAFVIPFHQEHVPLDQHQPTVELLRGLAHRGATLVPHGYTHRMIGSPRLPLAWLMAHWFARGEGEFAACSARETVRRLSLAAAIFERAGLGEHMVGFAPPAWLLSREAERAVNLLGFAFHERLGGIVCERSVVARRLIGWGSRTAIEAVATSLWAWLHTMRAPRDTRVAVHPTDVCSRIARSSLRRTIRASLMHLEPASYATYLATKRNVDRYSSAPHPVECVLPGGDE